MLAERIGFLESRSWRSFVVIVPHGTAKGAFEPVAQLSAIIAAALLTVMPVPLPFSVMMRAEASASISA